MLNFLDILEPGTDPKIDIVAVHGLNPRGKAKHGEGTWTASNDKLWLRDFLAPKIPEARILVFGYDSSVFKGSTMRITDHAKNLLSRLEHKRAEAPDRPIIFITHSLGGLVVKQAMVEAKQNDDPLRLYTYGIMFFATPHRGGNKAGFGMIVSNIINISRGKPLSRLVEALQKESVFLERLDSQFRNQLEDFHYVSFSEKMPYGVAGIVVDDRSAQLGLPWKRERVIALDRDHHSICKFKSDEDGDYQQVEDEVIRFVKDAITFSALQTTLRTPSQRLMCRSTPRFSSPNLFRSRYASPTLVSEGFASTDALASGPGRVIGGLPSEHQIRNFTGRQDLLLRLVRKLTSSESHSRNALYGLGGIGKTDVALRCAYDIKTYSTDISVLWISAANAELLQQSILDIARALQSTDAASSANILASIRNHLEDRENGRWVLIIDHADDFENLRLPQGEGELSSYIPNCPHGSVLLTTRNRKVATEFADKKSDERVSPLSQKESEALLYQLLDADQLQDGSGVQELTHLLECFPRAIVQAASFMRQNDITVQTYLRSFSESEHSALELLGHGRNDSKAVTTTWMISFKQLQANNQYAANLLSLMAFLNHRDIPESVLVAMENTKTPGLFIEACGTLKAFSFISESPVQATTTLGSKLFHVQPMVQTVMQHWLREHDQATKWCSAALVALSKVLESAEVSKDQWHAFDVCLPHVQTVSKHMIGSTSEQDLRATLLHNACWYFRVRGYHNTAKEMALEAMTIRKQLHGEEDETTLASMHSFALILFEQNDIKGAEELELQAIDTCKRKLGGENILTLRHQGHLARIWGVQSRYDEALEMQQKIFSSSMAIDPTCTDPSTWSAMRDLAVTLSYVGRQHEAESLQLQVYKVRSEKLGKDHPETLIVMSDLATSYIEQFRYKEAEELLKDVLPRSKQILGERHPNTIAAYEDYRAVLKHLGDNRNLRILDEVIRRMQREGNSPATAFDTKPNLKRTVSDSVVTYAYRTTQVERIPKNERSLTKGPVRGLGLDLALTRDIGGNLDAGDDRDDAEDDDVEGEEFGTIKKAIVLITSWAGTMPVFSMVSDALSEEHTVMVNPAEQKKTSDPRSSTTSPPLSLGSATLSIDDSTPPSQFEPLTRDPSFHTVQPETTLIATSSQEPVIYSDNKIVRSVQKKVERKVPKDTYDLAVKSGMDFVQDTRVKLEATQFKNLHKIRDIKSKGKTLAAFARKDRSQCEDDSEKLLLEAPGGRLLSEGKPAEMILNANLDTLPLENDAADN